MARACISKRAAKITIGISIFILILTVGLAFIFNLVYEILLKKYVSLGKGSIVTKIWEDIPLPIYEKLYFFNITNKEDFIKGLEPLNVTEVGPYVYRSRWIKDNPQWNANHTVSYRETRTYHFVPELSAGTEDDRIYTLNGPLIIGASIVPDSFRILFDYYCLLNREKIVIRKSIRELVYDGYEDSIIKKADILKLDLPFKDGKFAWLYGKNASNDGLFTVYTGTDDATKTDFINNWNGKESLNFWTDNSCNMLNGTSVETGPPITGQQDKYTFFQSFFCRSVTFDYTKDVEHYDILTKRFDPTYDLFANSTENPDNYCFEVNKERPSGILDISHCQYGAPVFMSFPHFYMADPSYLDSINGLNPLEAMHGSHIDVEPVTGVSVDITVRFQINVEIQTLKDFYFFEDVTKGIFPVFWAELSLKIDEDLANYLKRNVREPKIIGYVLLGVLHVIGWIGVIISTIVLCIYKVKEDNDLLIIKKDKVISPASNCSDSKERRASDSGESTESSECSQSSGGLSTEEGSKVFIENSKETNEKTLDISKNTCLP